MQLLKTSLSFEEFEGEGRRKWDDLGRRLRERKGGLGDLGGGNHFLDALFSYRDESVYALIHTGSRLESGLVDALVDQPDLFDREFARIVAWARANRDAVASIASETLEDLKFIIDVPHNTYERLSDGSVLIRKGAVRVQPGERTILPSSMSGDVALLEASQEVASTLNSLRHGTGRSMSRSDAKEIGNRFDFTALRRAIHIPEYIADSSLRTEGPFCYRDLESCLRLLGDLVEEQERFAVIAYLGHL
jgi:RNA-splicing ligase RtcB